MTNKDGEEIRKNIQLRFMDSYRFMISSIDKLVYSMDDDQCNNLREFYKRDGFLSLWGAKLYIRISIWMPGRNLRRQNNQQKDFTTS